MACPVNVKQQRHRGHVSVLILSRLLPFLECVSSSDQTNPAMTADHLKDTNIEGQIKDKIICLSLANHFLQSN